MHILLYLPLALVLLTAVLLALDSRSPLAGFYGRSIASWLLLTVCALYGVFASIVLRVVGEGGLSQWTTGRAFKWTMWGVIGVEFVVQGEEHLLTRPAVFVGNHQTELDVLMLGSVFPKYCSVTAKKSLKYLPFLGWFMALSKTVFIDRGNRASAKSAFDGAALTIRRDRQSVFIFPEGTRSYYKKPDLLPFKRGAFHLAVQAGVPVVPVVVGNYASLLNLDERKFTAGKIAVKVLPPVPTDKLTAADVAGFADKVRDQMLEELVKLAGLAEGHGVPAVNGGPTKDSKKQL